MKMVEVRCKILNYGTMAMLIENYLPNFKPYKGCLSNFTKI